MRLCNTSAFSSWSMPSLRLVQEASQGGPMGTTKLKLHVPPPREDDSIPFPSRAVARHASPRASWRLHTPAIDAAEDSLRRAQRSIEELERLFGPSDDDDRPRAA